MQTATSTIKPNDQLPDFHAGDDCPRHGSPHRKTYTFGSSMSAETDVCTFRGCKCVVVVMHDPVGTYPSVAVYKARWEDAAGVGKLRAMDAAVKYRD